MVLLAKPLRPIALAQSGERLNIYEMTGKTPPTKQLATSIRAARPSDIGDILRIARAAYAKYVSRIGREPAPMTADYAADIAARRVVLMEAGGALCGYMVAWPEGDAYFIENIGIEPRYQGMGLGRRLFAHAVSQAKSIGLAALSLYTNEAMTENLSMYAHIGFAETHRLSEYGFRRVYMRWTF